MQIYRISAFTIVLIINLFVYSTGMAMEKISASKLTAAETRVIVNKGTEPPFSGVYNDFFRTGTYCCKRCQSPLYRSNDKFKSTCGWPSFDDEIKGAIKKELDGNPPEKKRCSKVEFSRIKKQEEFYNEKVTLQ